MEKLSHLLKRVKLRQSIEPEGSSAQHAQILGMEGSGRWILCVCVLILVCAGSLLLPGLFCIAVCWLPIVVTSLVVEHWL